MAALLIKESVNQTVDAISFAALTVASRSTSSITHWGEVNGGKLSYGTVEYG